MGYAVMSARKIALQSRIDRLNFQLTCLTEAENAMSQRLSNYQRAYSMIMNQNNTMSEFACLSSIIRGCGNCQSFANFGSDFLDMFGQYATANLISSDISMQKQQIETQLKVATEELQKVEEAEDKAIKRSAPKYA